MEYCAEIAYWAWCLHRKVETKLDQSYTRHDLGHVLVLVIGDVCVNILWVIIVVWVNEVMLRSVSDGGRAWPRNRWSFHPLSNLRL